MASRADVGAPAAQTMEAPHAEDHDEYVDLPPEGSLPRWLIVLGILILLVGGVVGGAMWYYDRLLNPPGGPGETVSVEVPQGSSTSGIGSILEGSGVISNSMAFTFHVGRGNAGPFEAGIYELRKNSSVDLVVETMGRGPVAPLGSGGSASQEVRVTIPEGLTVNQLVERVADQVSWFEAEDLRAAVEESSVQTDLRPDGQQSYEGLFFPATYDVGPSRTEQEFLERIAREMETRIDNLDVDAAKERIRSTYGLELSTYDLLIVASMVQAEAGNAEEAPQIATVIYNRLERQIALGIDAADRYGANLAGTSVDYEDSSLPYNTRRKLGLPPTPISAPGDSALSAAFNPAEGEWIYYVLTDPNVHSFLETDAEFQRAKQICIQKGLGCG